MHELGGRRLVTRVRGRAALVRRLRSLFLAVHRFRRSRARMREDIDWTARTIDALTAALDQTTREDLEH